MTFASTAPASGIDRTASLLAQHCRELFNDLP